MRKVNGDNGNDVTQVLMDKMTWVGSDFNKFPSCRIDENGKAIEKVKALSAKTIKIKTAAPEVEPIDNRGDFLSGSYDIVATNSFSLLTGTGGIAITSAGNISLEGAGGIVNVRASKELTNHSEVVSILANQIINLKAKNIINIEASNLNIANKATANSNVFINGGLGVHGELFVNHITGPRQVMLTEFNSCTPVKFVPNCGLSGTAVMTLVGPSPEATGTFTGTVLITLDPITTSKAIATVLPHAHFYETIGSTLKDDISDVGELMKKCQSDDLADCEKTQPCGCTKDEFMKKVEAKIKHALKEWAADTAKRIMPSIF